MDQTIARPPVEDAARSAEHRTEILFAETMRRANSLWKKEYCIVAKKIYALVHSTGAQCLNILSRQL
jgi:hypothetical protein